MVTNVVGTFTVLGVLSIAGSVFETSCPLAQNSPNEACTSFVEAFLRQNGYPAYTTSIGWMGYSDEKIVNLCRKELNEGWTR